MSDLPNIGIPRQLEIYPGSGRHLHAEWGPEAFNPPGVRMLRLSHGYTWLGNLRVSDHGEVTGFENTWIYDEEEAQAIREMVASLFPKKHRCVSCGCVTSPKASFMDPTRCGPCYNHRR
jgi:hypothetical protein